MSDLPDPLGEEALRYLEPNRELYEHYASRVNESYPFFDIRPYEEAAEDFNRTFIPADDHLMSSEGLRMLVHQLTPPESFDRLIVQLGDYVEQYALYDQLAQRSLVFLTNHRRFSDLPLLAAAMTELMRADQI